MYDSFSENVDFWITTLYSEANETVNDIWSNARPFADEFLEDIRLVFESLKKRTLVFERNRNCHVKIF